MLVIEVLVLPQLDVLFYCQVFHHFVELVHFQEAVSDRVAQLEVVAVLKKEKGQQEGYVFFLGLQFAACLKVEQIVVKLKSLADCYFLVL